MLFSAAGGGSVLFAYSVASGEVLSTWSSEESLVWVFAARLDENLFHVLVGDDLGKATWLLFSRSFVERN